MPSSLYDRLLLPRLIDCACGLGVVSRQRARVVPRAHGRVLEIGIGTGLNLAHYDAGRVTGIVGVDPGVEMHPLAQRRARRDAPRAEAGRGAAVLRTWPRPRPPRARLATAPATPLDPAGRRLPTRPRHPGAARRRGLHGRAALALPAPPALRGVPLLGVGGEGVRGQAEKRAGRRISSTAGCQFTKI